MDYKRVLKDKDGESIFIRTTRIPPLPTESKAALNRKGNALCNAGDIEGARRIFLTTGYTDGLVRVGDYYRSKGRMLDALRMYWIAPDRKKAEPIIMQLSQVIRNLISQGDNNE